MYSIKTFYISNSKSQVLSQQSLKDASDRLLSSLCVAYTKIYLH